MLNLTVQNFTMQIFTITTIFPFISSFWLIMDIILKKINNQDSFIVLLNNYIIKKEYFPILIMGYICILSSFLQFIFSMDIPILGDILPSFINFILGISLIIDYTTKKVDKSPSVISSEISIKIQQNKDIIGFFGIILNIIHFLVPTVLFL